MKTETQQTATNGHGNGNGSGPKIEIKNVKHTLDNMERNQLGGDLARAISELRGVNNDFDQVKAGFKAKITEKEAKIDNLSTLLVNGFEMRNERCVVIYRPKERKKDYFREEDHVEFGADAELLLTEDMTADDFQAELLQAESKFDGREEIQLFQPTETDRGVLVVGRFAGKWFSALRVKIGKVELNERLDSEQKCFKQRPDAVANGVKRVTAWAKENFKEHAKGFEAKFQDVILQHAERAE